MVRCAHGDPRFENFGSNYLQILLVGVWCVRDSFRDYRPKVLNLMGITGWEVDICPRNRLQSTQRVSEDGNDSLLWEYILIIRHQNSNKTVQRKSTEITNFWSKSDFFDFGVIFSISLKSSTTSF